MDENNRNFILAILLSLGVLFAWQVLFLPKTPPPPDTKQAGQQEQQRVEPGTPQPPPQGGGAPEAGAPQAGPAAGTLTREEALAKSPRIAIDTPSLKGSIALKGGRIDDLTLKDYRETVEPNSPNVVLLSPEGSQHPYYVERGFISDKKDEGLPGANTLWTATSSEPLTTDTPATLVYDNGKGLLFTRTIAVDEHYMFTIDDKVENTGSDAINLYPYGRVARSNLPAHTSFYILHEGLIGLGDSSVDCGHWFEGPLCAVTFKDAETTPRTLTSKSGWLGITDKYWAAVLVPQQGVEFRTQLSGSGSGEQAHYQADYLQIAPLALSGQAVVETKGYIFAGAKEVHLLNRYTDPAGGFAIPKLDLLIDWGWFYFLTRPMFYALDFFYKLVGNFGVAILVVTLILKLILFPLANKSYVSMSKMKKLGPEMQRIKERYGDDRMRQQQAMMDLYKKEKVNPASGCLPILVQIPIFFALYKVLFITIEMRHAPFFGWIQDLSAPDPTNVFNLFGLLPFDPSQLPVIGHFLMIGIWPIIMGITMWVQMQLNPAPPDPVQQKIFAWMPVFFTFLLASFPAGLVIYWAWNNLLSVIQQSVIMSRQGVEIPLLENLGFKNNKSKAKG
jgi:YidC/Oxa1 family membrane protein insertase